MADYRCSYCPRTAPPNGSPRNDQTPNGWVWDKWGINGKVFCSNECLNKYQNSNHNNSSQVVTKSDATSIENSDAEARKAEAKSQENTSKWNAYAQLGTAAFSAASSSGKEVKETTDYIAKIIFSNDPEELGNQLSEICSMWGGAEKYMLKDSTEAVKKAAFEKFEFGMMKLKQVGASSQIEFFEKKHKEMKPKKFFGLF